MVSKKGFRADEILEAVTRLLDRAKYGDARRAAADGLRRAPQAASCHYAMGLVLTQLNRTAEADQAFARAAELQSAEYFRPHRVGREEFERLVEDVLASLPEEFGRHLENVEVAVEDVPERNLLREGDVGHDLLGLYQGDTIQSEMWDLPDRILLFQRNLENISPDRETLVKEIRATVLHEVGHHLGMDEDDLERIELDEE